MDIIRLEKIELYAHHGVASQEQELGQRFALNLELYTDLTHSAMTDELTNTLNYQTIYDTVATVFCSERNQLIERAAWRVLEALFKTFDVEEIGISVHKLSPPVPGMIGGAEVELFRTRSEVLGESI